MAIESSSHLGDYLDLVDYRRRVAELYVDLRRRGLDRRSWEAWCRARIELLSTHPQSPLQTGREIEAPATATAVPAPVEIGYFDYDPSWQVVATVEPFDRSPAVGRVAEGDSTFAPIGTVVFERLGTTHRLGLFWLEAYGGGLFLPFGDPTNGTTTYGGGRYLLDGAKSADLGGSGPGRLLLDFNFAYHPSCVWDPRWPCPLAPPTNRLGVAVEAGEQCPSPGGPSRCGS